MATHTTQPILTRQQKLAFAVAMAGLSVVLSMVLVLVRPNANTPLAGAAVGGRIPLETLLAFAGGIALGSLVIWL